MDNKEHIEMMVDALDHITKVVASSRTQTRRLRWIAVRAQCAIDGNEDWKDIDLPKKAKLSLRESKMQTFIDKNLSKITG